MKFALVALALLWPFSAADAQVPTNDLIAFFPLRNNGNDSLSKNPSFVLTNTIFQSALLVSGVYEPNGHFVNYLGAGPLPGLHYDSFTISLDFCPDPKGRKRKQLTRPESFLNFLTRGSYGKWVGYGNNDQLNIITGGQGYRWIGFNREDNRLTLTLNNQGFTHRFTDVRVQPNRWHTLICSVDLGKRQVQTFFDGRRLDTINLPPEFKLEIISAPDVDRDREFTFANYSNGSVYRGYAANFKIFGRALTAEEIALLPSSSFAGLPTFPAQSSALLFLCLALVSLVGLVVLFVVWRRVRPELPREPAPTK